MWYRERHSVLRFCDLTRGSTFVSAASNLAETASMPDAWRTSRRTRIHVGSSGGGWEPVAGAISEAHGLASCYAMDHKTSTCSEASLVANCHKRDNGRKWRHCRKSTSTAHMTARNTRFTSNAGKCELIPAISMCKFLERCLLAPELTATSKSFKPFWALPDSSYGREDKTMCSDSQYGRASIPKTLCKKRFSGKR